MNCLGFGNESEGQNDIRDNNNSTLPPIKKSIQLKHEQSYDKMNNSNNVQENKQDKKQINKFQSNSSSSSSLLSSSSSSISSIDPAQEKILKSQEKIQPLKAQKPQYCSNDTQSQEHAEYKQKSVQQIAEEIKSMRKQFLSMNQKVSQMLDLYHMAKKQFVSKQLLAPSKSQFYQAQIQTNKKVEQSQIAELKKLNETQVNVKDKDILLDLQNILIEMRESLHQAKKQEHDEKLKNHKKDLILEEIIKVNNDNKDNNTVKLLKLQIIYYMKKQNSLKTHEQQLEHQQKLILQNQKHLEQKVQEMKKSNKNYFLFDQNYLKIKAKYQTLLGKKKNLQKQIGTLKKANLMNQQKLTTEITSLKNQYKTLILPKTIRYEQQNKELETKIMQLMKTYQINQKNLKQISYKFQPQIYKKNNDSTRKLSISLLKPNLRPKSNFSNEDIHSARGQQTQISSPNKNIYLTSRQNDKNISMTIDVNLQQKERSRSISDASTNFKPRNFRLMSKKEKEKDPSLNLQRNHTYSMTIDHITGIEQNLKLEKPKLLKPKLLIGGSLTKR